MPELHVNGGLEHRLPHNLNVSFPGVDTEILLRTLETVAVSSGAACSSASIDGSYVVKALPGGREHAASSIRIGIGRFTTEQEVRFAAREIVAAAEVARSRPESREVCGALAAA